MRVVDLFAGMGGMSLGFQHAGYQIIAAYEHWQPAIAVYRANFSHPLYTTDLRFADLTQLSNLAPDMIIGGPPCQDFSSAGKRDETGQHADLTIVFSRIIASVKPTWFVMENVDRIQKTSVLRNSQAIFRQSGYGLTEYVLNASLCGVPQLRKRYFLIGHLGGVDDELGYYLQKKFNRCADNSGTILW